MRRKDYWSYFAGVATAVVGVVAAEGAVCAAAPVVLFSTGMDSQPVTNTNAVKPRMQNKNNFLTNASLLNCVI